MPILHNITAPITPNCVYIGGMGGVVPGPYITCLT